MNLIPWRKPSVELERSDPALSFNDWAEFVTSFSFQGINYTLPGAKQEDLDGRFPLMARSAYKSSGVVFAVILNRVMLFSEARFMFQRIRGGRPGDLFGNQDLALLETPWPNGTTGDLLARMELYNSLAGNAYVVRRRGKLAILRPDWVTIIGGVRDDADATVWHPDAEILGYAYQEGGPALGKDPMLFLPEEVAHFAPNPDPEARFRGMSWLTPVIREIQADKAATEHKLAFFENAATPNLAVKLNVEDLEKFKKWIEEFKAQKEGVSNAYKTLFLGAGADVTPIGADMRQMDFKVTQGAGETRIAAAGGVPPVIVGLSEGLAAATYSNYGQAKRRMADNTARPWWRQAAACLQTITRTPDDARLWYDDRDISALQEDQKDAAEIQATRSQSIRTLLDAGYTAESVISAVTNDDFTLLKHSGLFSVQLRPPGEIEPAGDDETPGSASQNGSGNGAVPALNEAS